MRHSLFAPHRCLQPHVSDDDYEARKKEIRLNDRFAVIDEEKMKGEMMLSKSISYILARLQLGTLKTITHI